MSLHAAANRAGVLPSTWNRWETADPTRPMQLTPLVLAGVDVGELVRWAAHLLTDGDRMPDRD